MPGVLRYAGGLCAVAIALALASGPAATAAPVPDGPHLTVVVDNLADERWADILTMSPTGGERRRLIVNSGRERPSWSADGSLLTFGAYGDDWDGSAVGVARVDAEAPLRFYRRATLEGDPVMAPDGRSVAFSRTRLVKVLPGRENYLVKSAIWLLDPKSGAVRRLTRWRLQTSLVPTGFSADGSKIAATAFDFRRGLRAVAVDVSSGRFSLLARNAMEPIFSPDGSRFLFVRDTSWRLRFRGIDDTAPAIDELRIGRVGRVVGARLLLRRRGFFASPDWDPAGERISFMHSPVDEFGVRSAQYGNRLMAINPDGTCLTRVFRDPELIVYGATWQPGPGREAGRIEC